MVPSKATVSKGWFKAPATGNYRFYISCDDACKLFLDETTAYGAGTPTLSEKAVRHWATEWRHYFMTPDAAD